MSTNASKPRSPFVPSRLMRQRVSELKTLAARDTKYRDVLDSLNNELKQIASGNLNGSQKADFHRNGYDLSDCHKTYVRHQRGNQTEKPPFRLVWRELTNGQIELLNFGLRQDELAYTEAGQMLDREPGMPVVGTNFDPSPNSLPARDAGYAFPPLFNETLEIQRQRDVMDEINREILKDAPPANKAAQSTTSEPKITTNAAAPRSGPDQSPESSFGL